MFNLTDYFNIGFLRSSNRLLTKSEVEKIHNKYVPDDIDLEVYKGGSGATYLPFLKRIEISNRDLYEEVLLHEIGHAVTGRIKGTANYELEHMTEGQLFSRDIVLKSEQEAWDWAEKHSSKPWGFRTKTMIKVSLRSYRVNLPEELEFTKDRTDK